MILPIMKVNQPSPITGRIYSQYEVDKIISLFDKQVKLIGPLYGEYPQTESILVSELNASHVVKNIFIENDILYGEIELLKDIPNINLLKLVFRGMGWVTTDNYAHVTDIITFDLDEHTFKFFQGFNDFKY